MVGETNSADVVGENGISPSSYCLAVSPGYRRLRSSAEGPEAEPGWLANLGRQRDTRYR